MYLSADPSDLSILHKEINLLFLQCWERCVCKGGEKGREEKLHKLTKTWGRLKEIQFRDQGVKQKQFRVRWETNIIERERERETWEGGRCSVGAVRLRYQNGNAHEDH